MKALSIRQPWASLIASGAKTIETRTWPTHHRGDILICASKSGKLKASPLKPADSNRPVPQSDEPRGYALCIARIVDCRPMTSADESRACCAIYPRWAWIPSKTSAPSSPSPSADR